MLLVTSPVLGCGGTGASVWRACRPKCDVRCAVRGDRGLGERLHRPPRLGPHRTGGVRRPGEGGQHSQTGKMLGPVEVQREGSASGRASVRLFREVSPTVPSSAVVWPHGDSSVHTESGLCPQALGRCCGFLSRTCVIILVCGGCSVRTWSHGPRRGRAVRTLL